MEVGRDTLPGQRRVGEDDAVNLVGEQALHHGRDVSVVQIGSKLDEDRRRAPENSPAQPSRPQAAHSADLALADPVSPACSAKRY